MGLKLKTLAATTVNMASLDATATAITVTTAGVFPTLTAGDYFHAVLKYADGATLPDGTDASQTEIVKVTGVAGNTLTVERGAENTALQSTDYWHTTGNSVVVALVAVASDMELLTGRINQAYAGEAGGSLGTTSARVPLVAGTDINGNKFTINDLVLRKAGVDDSATNLILPAKDAATDSVDERTLATKGDLGSGFDITSGGVRFGRINPATSYPALGGKRGDFISILKFSATQVVLASPVAGLVAAPGGGANTIFGGTQNSPSLGDTTISGTIANFAGADGLSYAVFNGNAAWADAQALYDAILGVINASGNTTKGLITSTDDFGEFSAPNGFFGSLNVYCAPYIRGLQQPPVYVAADNAEPAATDDIKKGFIVGSRWLTANGIKEFMCLSNTAGAASWKQTRGMEEIWSGTADNTSTTHSLTSGKEFDDYTNLLFIGIETNTPWGRSTAITPSSLFGTTNTTGIMVPVGGGGAHVPWIGLSVIKVSNTSFRLNLRDNLNLTHIYGIF